MIDMSDKKWVSIWANAPSYSEQRAENYARDITLRYYIFSPFCGDKIRLHFSNFAEKNQVTLDSVFICPMKGDEADVSKSVRVTFGAKAMAQAVLDTIK